MTDCAVFMLQSLAGFSPRFEWSLLAWKLGYIEQQSDTRLYGGHFLKMDITNNLKNVF